MFSDNEILNIVYKIADILNEFKKSTFKKYIISNNYRYETINFNDNLSVDKEFKENILHRADIEYYGKVLKFDISFFNNKILFGIPSDEDYIVYKEIESENIDNIYKYVKSFKMVDDILSNDFK